MVSVYLFNKVYVGIIGMIKVKMKYELTMFI